MSYGRCRSPRRLRPLASWESELESRWGMYVYLLWVLCVMHVEATATGRSPVQRRYTFCMCVIESDQGNSDPLRLQWIGRTWSTERKSSSMSVLKFKNVFPNETVESASYLPRFFLINKLYCITELHIYWIIVWLCILVHRNETCEVYRFMYFNGRISQFIGRA
jgi:hypothetical protein